MINSLNKKNKWSFRPSCNGSRGVSDLSVIGDGADSAIVGLCALIGLLIGADIALGLGKLGRVGMRVADHVGTST